MKIRCDLRVYTRKIAVVLLLLLASGTVLAGLPETVTKVKKSVVSVGTYQRLRAPAAVFKGTGFVVSKGNHIITNAHVIPEVLNHAKKEIIAEFFPSDQFFKVFVRGRNNSNIHRDGTIISNVFL